MLQGILRCTCAAAGWQGCLPLPSCHSVQAAQQAELAAELGGEALVEQCRSLQVDLTNCQQVRVHCRSVFMLGSAGLQEVHCWAVLPVQPPLMLATSCWAASALLQALLDKEVESLEKDRQLAALQARCVPIAAGLGSSVAAACHIALRCSCRGTSFGDYAAAVLSVCWSAPPACHSIGFLERYARVYETSDKCIQTDPPPRASASAQFPSLQVGTGLLLLLLLLSRVVWLSAGGL